MNLLSLSLDAAAGCAGAAFGLIYFSALRRSISLLANGARWQMVVLLSLLRVGLAVAAFLLLARFGAIPVICGAAGFLLARTILIRKAQRQS